MLIGAVSDNRAFVRLTLRGLDGRAGSADFVLDTGFTGALTLPTADCAAMGLPFLRRQPAGLADGSAITLRVYQATLLWDGEERLVEVLAMDQTPLVGMAALEGSEVRLQITDGGLVTIEPL